MKKNILFTLLIFLLGSLSVSAREIINFNEGWGFKKGSMGVWGVFPNIYIPQADKTVNLPHTYNDEDFMNDEGYYRGLGSYLKEIEVPESWKGKRIFLKCEGAGTTAAVFVNWNHVGTHKGAYNAFCFELTNYFTYGIKNYILITCDNSHQFDVAPQGGDFNLYGGLYRDVYLEIMDDVCISPLYYGSDGLLVTQKLVTEKHAELQAEVHLSTLSDYKNCEVELSLLDAGGKVISRKVSPYINNDKCTINFSVENPHLWNGVSDPYLYKVTAVLKRDGKEVDRVEDQIGLRYFYIDADKGFFLNGNHLKLRGVSRHQDWAGLASALTRKEHLTDLDIIQEMGVNSIRLAHYPQAHFMFEEADRRGLLVWEEIPFVGSYVAGKEFDDHLKFQLTEMIVQNYNHPSIFCWGLWNEINGDFNAIAGQLNDLAHQLDPVRLTTLATCNEGTFNFTADLVGWNKYFGWYEGAVSGFAPFFDNWHKTYPDAKICVSEYGSGAAFSIHASQVDDTPTKPQDSRGHYHPMEKQTFSHRLHLQMITERDYLWGSYVWNMFDFASAMRREGDTNNLNDKGLVSQDRQRRKDAFYLYKANWNKKEATVHLCSKDYTQRKEDVTDIIAFTTAPQVKLFLNGKQIGTQKTDAYATVEFKNVKLQKGENKVEIRTPQGNDSAVWFVE